MAIQNSGTTATTADSFLCGIYLSRDAVITTGDIRIHSRTLFSLGRGEIYSVTPTVDIPRDTAPGSYYIGVIADFDNSQPETNETNNALAGSRIDVE
jgi:subtilase family serine protease